MKTRVFFLALGCAAVVAACGEPQNQGKTEQGKDLVLDTHEKKLSYATAYVFQKQMVANEVPLDMDVFLAGLDDAFGDAEPRMTAEEMAETSRQFMVELNKRREESGQFPKMVVKDEYLEKQRSFLEENKNKDGVVSLASGLQYEILEHAEGPGPGAADTVVVNYRGTLVDGTEFDSSYARGEPGKFSLDGVIPGWQEALGLMAQGSKWRIVVPANLGYGPAGYGTTIPGYSVLVFEIELLEIVAG